MTSLVAVIEYSYVLCPNYICRFVAIILKMKLDYLTEIRMHLGATHFIRPGINIFPTRSFSNIVINNLTKTTSIMV